MTNKNENSSDWRKSNYVKWYNFLRWRWKNRSNKASKIDDGLRSSKWILLSCLILQFIAVQLIITLIRILITNWFNITYVTWECPGGCCVHVAHSNKHEICEREKNWKLLDYYLIKYFYDSFAFKCWSFIKLNYTQQSIQVQTPKHCAGSGAIYRRKLKTVVKVLMKALHLNRNCHLV